MSPAKRSALMSRIRGKNTVPEMTVRRIVHALGYRYRLHCRDLPGTPDLVFRRMKKIIFVHGCFWHRHQDCKYAYTPKSRQVFWRKKFRLNKQRDLVHMARLKNDGWRVLVVWECELASPKSATNKINRFLERRGSASTVVRPCPRSAP